MKPSVVRVVVKDIIDFFIVMTFSFLLTLSIYFLVPTFTKIDLSFYFFEQYAELFFVNPKLIFWALGLGLGVNIIYFLFSTMLYETTIGGLVVRVGIVDKKRLTPLSLYQAFLMAVGSYAGVLLVLLSPLWAWWMDQQHRGFSEKLSQTLLIKKTHQ